MARTIVALLGALLLLMLGRPWEITAQSTVWERNGLEGREVLALAIAPDSAIIFAIAGGARDPTPLWQREGQGWTRAARGLPGLVLTVAPLPEVGILLGTGRDIADQPGVFWVGGSPLASRRLYDSQAVGALAVAPRRGRSDVYAASAPWADRDAGSDLLRRDTATGAWTTVLRGGLACGPTPSYFKQIVAPPSESARIFALEWCFTSMVRESQLWRSEDRGQTWEVMPRLGAAPWVIGTFAVHHGDQDALYVAGFTQAGSPAVGVERSADGGRSWSLSGEAEGLAHVRVLVVDPRNSGRVLAGTERAGVFASDDRGETWHPLRGLEGIRIWGLTINEAEDQLYAATADGVWRTPLGTQ